MTDYEKYINALRKCAKEHENDMTFTGHIIVSDLCRDTANLLETIEQDHAKLRGEIEDCLKALDEIEKSGLNIYLPNEMTGRRLTYKQCLEFIDKCTESEG